jgi:microcystin-dependent protein
MSEPFVGEIRIFAGNFAPRGWAFCNGQLLSIAQNTPLFALLGTTYGGNGSTTFALPNLQGRAPMHWGNGAGLTPRQLGESSGSPTVTLLSTEIPAHTHQFTGTASAADQASPGQNVLADTEIYANPPNATLSPTTVGAAGGSQPHNNMMPYLGLTFIIALQGVFPARD